MSAEELRCRTMQFAIRIIHFIRSLPHKMEYQVMGKQLLRSATSVAANYRAAGRARSRAEFYSKLSIVVEEADEVVFWLEMIQETGISSEELRGSSKEARELLYILSTSRKSTRENMSRTHLTK